MHMQPNTKGVKCVYYIQCN